MKKLILIMYLFNCVYSSLAQIEIEFGNEAAKYYNLNALKKALSPCYCVRATDTTAYKEKMYSICDTVEYFHGELECCVYDRPYFPLMKNLKAISIVDQRNWYLEYHKNSTMQPLNLSQPIEFCEYFGMRFPIILDFNQFSSSLKVLRVLIWEKTRTSTFDYDFSSFDSLKYLAFIMESCQNNWMYRIKFPPNLYCLDWTVNPYFPDIPIPPTVEILFLRMESNACPPMIYKLPNLKVLSILSYLKYKNIPLPKELATISSLKTLEMDGLTKENIEIISQMENLDTLAIFYVKRRLPSNFYKLKRIKFIQFYDYRGDPDVVIQKMNTILPDITIVSGSWGKAYLYPELMIYERKQKHIIKPTKRQREIKRNL